MCYPLFLEYTPQGYHNLRRIFGVTFCLNFFVGLFAEMTELTKHRDDAKLYCVLEN